MPRDAPLLPVAALLRWRAVEAERWAGESPERVVAWLRLQAVRMLASGGREPRGLVDAGLCDTETLVACVRAQLDAGRPSAEPWCAALEHDVETDISAVAELAELEIVQRLSERLAESPWRDLLSVSEAVHFTLVERLFGVGRDRDAELAVERVHGYYRLVELLEGYGARLASGARKGTLDRLEEAADWMMSTIWVGDQVAFCVEHAVRTGDRGWLERAEALADLRAQGENCTEERDAHPLEELAFGVAKLGEFGDAMAIVARMSPADRLWALRRLAPLAPDPEARAALLEEIVDRVDGDDAWWVGVIIELPDTVPRVLPKILAIEDEEVRFDAVARVLSSLPIEQAEPLWTWMVDRAERLPVEGSTWHATWESVLSIVEDSGRKWQLAESTCRWLIDEVSARPELTLWRQITPLVPEDRVVAVLELSLSRLVDARLPAGGEWLGIGWALLSRAPDEWAVAWPSRAAEILTRSSGYLENYLGHPWTREQRRQILSARLRRHQRRFLPEQLFLPWLKLLCANLPAALTRQVEAMLASPKMVERVHPEEPSLDLPIVVATDPEEQAACRATLDALLALPGWPSTERVGWVVAFLGRCSGEGAVLEVARVLVEMTAEIDREDWR